MSSGKFITNKEIVLSETIAKIFPTTSKIDFLVGFFYFSGFGELYKGMEDKKLRILVGMDIELQINKTIKEVYKIEDKSNIKKEDFIIQLKNAFNKTDIFDNKKNIDSVNLFISKIKDGTLEVRRTREPNHSKLYLFYESEATNHGGDRPGTLITGSSNFTYSGLTGRHELNARFDDKASFEEGQMVFDELWADSIEITTGGEDDEVVQMLKEETWLKIPSPYYCYLRLLKEYFLNNKTKNLETPESLSNGEFNDLEYQIKAIQDSIGIIEQHNGVIISDVVGLGKSIIGSSIIGNLGRKAIVICPPHLKKQWEEYGELFGLNLKIYSSGLIEEALMDDIKYGKRRNIILIDEAHRYRNDDNIDYGFLHRLTRNKKVILLTATPFNNAPKDIFNLIKLFQIPKKSTITSSSILTFEFRILQKEYIKLRDLQKQKKIEGKELNNKLESISKKIKKLISPVVIRRSRVDLEKNLAFKADLEKQGFEYSEVKKPKTIEYELGDVKDLYMKTISELLSPDIEKMKDKKFTCARYAPLLYLKKEKLAEDGDYYKSFMKIYGYSILRIEGRQQNMPLFITRLLVSRFESSIYSFKRTLNNILKKYSHYEKWLNAGIVPIVGKGALPEVEDLDYEEIDSFMNNDDFDYSKFKDLDIEEINILLKKNNGFAIKLEDMEDNLMTNFKNDKKFIEGLKEKWGEIDEDPKFKDFSEDIIKMINKEPENKGEPKRKIVVFSQYSDTIDYLYENLEKRGVRVLKITGSNKTKKAKIELRENFDAGLKLEEQKDNYDIVVATDAISEGYNLHRAGTIINYDIPYNPTIVIQRVGRINRINKKVFENLYIYNYFPSLHGEELIRTSSISKLKINMINSILGSDTRILDENETLESFLTHILEKDELEEEESWETEFENFLYNVDKKELSDCQKIPDRSRVKRKSEKHKNKVIIFAKKGKGFVFKIIDKISGEIETLGDEDAFRIFEALKEEKGDKTSEDFYKYYDKLKKSLFKIDKESKIDPSVSRVITNIGKFGKNEFDLEYKKLLLKVINELDGLPKVYLSMLRDLSKDNYKEKIDYFKDKVPVEYLEGIISDSNEYDNKEEELIISEEF